MTANANPQTIYPTLRCRDARAVMTFLVDALGFRTLSVTAEEDGPVGHAELAYGDGVVMLGSVGPEPSPFDTGRACIYVALDDPDAHHDKAVAAGAKVVMELTDQPYGSREYGAEDPDGNVWVFGTYRPQVS
jgi:uncharacterized glyoxalase superfamily protein PhnB